MSTTLSEAVEIINSANGRHAQQPLIKIANCDECGQEFPMQVQDYNRAEAHGLNRVCPECRPAYHRNKKKKQ